MIVRTNKEAHEWEEKNSLDHSVKNKTKENKVYTIEVEETRTHDNTYKSIQ